MPLYEYRCGKCRKEFEAYKRLSEDSGQEGCPTCGEPSARVGISIVRPGGGGDSAGGSSCGSRPRRSPFG